MLRCALCLFALLLTLSGCQGQQPTLQGSGHFTARDGTQLHYLAQGEGDPLILLHGYGSSAGAMVRLMDALGQDRLCIALDQRGYGQSPAAGEASIGQSARDVADLMAALDLEQTSLLGFSMGGAVVFSYLEQFGAEGLDKVVIGDMAPRLVNDQDWKLGCYQGWYTQADLARDLTLFTPAGYPLFSLRFTDQLSFPRTPETPRDLDQSLDQLIQDLAPRLGTTPEQLNAQADALAASPPSQAYLDLARSYWQSMGEMDFRPLLPTISCPTALVYADPGSLFSPATFTDMAQKIPNATLLPMADSIHTSPMEQAAPEILAFLAE